MKLSTIVLSAAALTGATLLPGEVDCSGGGWGDTSQVGSPIPTCTGPRSHAVPTPDGSRCYVPGWPSDACCYFFEPGLDFQTRTQRCYEKCIQHGNDIMFSTRADATGGWSHVTFCLCKKNVVINFGSSTWWSQQISGCDVVPPEPVVQNDLDTCVSHFVASQNVDYANGGTDIIVDALISALTESFDNTGIDWKKALIEGLIASSTPAESLIPVVNAAGDVVHAAGGEVVSEIADANEILTTTTASPTPAQSKLQMLWNAIERAQARMQEEDCNSFCQDAVSRRIVALDQRIKKIIACGEAGASDCEGVEQWEANLYSRTHVMEGGTYTGR